MSLPEKLIAVGMRYHAGAESYIKQLKLPQAILLKAEKNAEASGGVAYAVYHRGSKLAYIREADLGTLKRETATAKFSTIPFSDIVDKYEISQQYPNYLVIKLSSAKECEQYNISISDTTCATPVSAEVVKTIQKNLIQNKGKETMFDKIVNTNKAVAVTAAYMEAGRIANNQVTKLVAAKAPLMVKGYIDTPVGKVVIANLTDMAVKQFRPMDAKLQKVSQAMMTQAYQELIQTIDIEGMLNELASSEGIKAALAVVAEPDLVKA